jgi:hypothetical protein
MDAETYLESLEAQSKASIEPESPEIPETEVRQNPFNKQLATETLKAFEAENQEDPTYFNIYKLLEEGNPKSKSFVEKRQAPPESGWHSYIQKKFVDKIGRVTEWIVELVPNYKDKKGNTAKGAETLYRIEPSLEAKEKLETNPAVQVAPISEDEIVSKIKNLMFDSFANKDKEKASIRNEVLTGIKEMKELITPESSKETAGLMTKMFETIANKKDGKDEFDKLKDLVSVLGLNKKDDGNSEVLKQISDMRDDFNQKLLDINEQRHQEQMEAFRKEIEIKDKYEKVIEEIKEKATKPVRLIDQITDMEKLEEYATKMGYKKTGADETKEDWKETLASGIKDIIPQLPSLLPQIVQSIGSMFGKNPMVSGAPQNVNLNPQMPNNMGMPNMNTGLPYTVPVPILNNAGGNNPAPMPNPAPAPQPQQVQQPAFQVNQLLLKQMSLLNNLEKSFDEYRHYKKAVEKKVTEEELTEIKDSLSDAYTDVINAIIDINPQIADTLEDIDMTSHLNAFLNDTKQVYPQMYEKLNSLVGKEWMSNLAYYIKAENIEEHQEETQDVSTATAN